MVLSMRGRSPCLGEESMGRDWRHRMRLVHVRRWWEGASCMGMTDAGWLVLLHGLSERVLRSVYVSGYE